MEKCSLCGHVNLDGAAVCAECGAPLAVAAAVCPSCGKSVKPGLKFCTACGAKLEENPVPPAPVAAPAPERPACRNCGQPIKPGVKFCTACGTPVQSGDTAIKSKSASSMTDKTPKPTRSGKFGKKELFAAIAGGLAFLTTLFALIFVLTPFVSIKVSALGMSQKEAAGGISMFASIIKGNDTLSMFGVSAWIGYVASACYWIFAFVFAAYFTYAIATAGGAGDKQFKTGIKFLAAMTVLSLVMLILGQTAMGQAMEEANTVEALGVKVSKYVGPTGLFVTMLLMLGGYIALFVLSKNTETRPAYPKCAKAKKPLKIILPIVLSVLLAISCIVGVVGLVGGSGKSLVKKFINGVNANDVTAVAECMYPKDSADYTQFIAEATVMINLGGNLSEEVFGGTLTDWSYEKTEKNDYIERGALSGRVDGERISATFYLQKSSYDNKWYVTMEYDAEFYDGKLGTSYANAVEMRREGGYISGTGSSGTVYGLYECAESGKYTVTSGVSFRAETFEQSSVGGSSTSDASSGVYVREFSMTKGKAYYFVFSGASASCTIVKTGETNTPDGTIKTEGTLSESNSTSVTLSATEKYYKLTPNTSTYYAVFDTSDYRYSETVLYNADKQKLAEMSEDGMLVYKLETSKTYYVGIQAERGYSGNSASLHVCAAQSKLPLSLSTQAEDAFSGKVALFTHTFTPSQNSDYTIQSYVGSSSANEDSDFTVAVSIYDEDGTEVEIDAQEQYALATNTNYTILLAAYSTSSSAYSRNVYTRIATVSGGLTRDTAGVVTPGVPQPVTIRDGQKLWYKFTAEGSYSCTIYSTGNIDTYAIFYDYDGSRMVKDDDSGDNRNFRITYNVTSGTTYYVEVYPYNSGTANFTLHVSRYENGSDYDMAYTLTRGSSKSVNYNSGNETYHRFIATANGTVNIYTQGNTAVRVKVQNAEGTEIVSKLTVSPANADLTLNVAEGEVYYILVGYINSPSSNSTLYIS